MCGSLNTKRNGTRESPGSEESRRRRFWCHDCCRSFGWDTPSDAAGVQSRVRFPPRKLEATRLYVEGLSSYRILSRILTGYGIEASAMTLNRWVLEVARAARTPLEVSAQVAASTAPAWGGFLGLDGKAIWIRGVKHAVMVGVDHLTQDVVHALVVPAETGEHLARLVTESVTDAGYPLKGLVTDLGPGFRDAIGDYFGDLAHQACRVHADRRLDQYIPRSGPLAAELKSRIRSILYAPTLQDAIRRYHQLLDHQHRYQGLGRQPRRNQRPYDPIASLQANFDLYMTHHRISGIPPNNNTAENVIRQLGRKPRLMESFSTTHNADAYFRLLIACYRLKPFTDSHNGHNHKSPLQLAGLDPPPNNWLTHHLNPPTAT